MRMSRTHTRQNGVYLHQARGPQGDRPHQRCEVPGRAYPAGGGQGGEDPGDHSQEGLDPAAASQAPAARYEGRFRAAIPSESLNFSRGTKVSSIYKVKTFERSSCPRNGEVK